MIVEQLICASFVVVGMWWICCCSTFTPIACPACEDPPAELSIENPRITVTGIAECDPAKCDNDSCGDLNATYVFNYDDTGASNCLVQGMDITGIDCDSGKRHRNPLYFRGVDEIHIQFTLFGGGGVLQVAFNGGYDQKYRLAENSAAATFTAEECDGTTEVVINDTLYVDVMDCDSGDFAEGQFCDMTAAVFTFGS